MKNKQKDKHPYQVNTSNPSQHSPDSTLSTKSFILV
jgi:hypothetical protein